MFNKLLRNIGYSDDLYDSDFTKCLREEAIKWACVLKISECEKAAASELEANIFPKKITDNITYSTDYTTDNTTTRNVPTFPNVTKSM